MSCFEEPEEFSKEYLGDFELEETSIFSTEEVVNLYKRGYINHNEIGPYMNLSFTKDGSISKHSMLPDITMGDVCYLKDLVK